MDIEQAVKVLRAHNKWRRSTSDVIEPMPYRGLELGLAIDSVCEYVEKSSAAQRIGTLTDSTGSTLPSDTDSPPPA